MQDQRAEQSRTVVHIAPTPFFADRGCHIRIRNEIDSLKEYPYRIIVCTYPIGRDVNGIDSRRTWPIPGYHKLDTGFSPFRFIADFFLFFLTLKTVWQERPVLLHCHLHEGALIGWAVKICLLWRRLPVIMDMQGSLTGELTANDTFGSLSFLVSIFKKVEQFICLLPDFFLCSSRQSRECLLNEFAIDPSKIMLVQDVVPDAVFAAVASSAGSLRKQIPADKQVILYTGSLQPGKGIQHVLEAMKMLAASRDDLFFVLVGYPLEDASQFVQAHKLENHCLLPGQVDYADLPSWLSLGDVAVEPKEAESGEASGKLLHYMAAGLPVVCFATGNNQQMLGTAGYYAASNDGQGLAAAVEDALSDRKSAIRRGEEGRERANATYSSAAVGDILHRLYDRFGNSD